MTKPIQRAFLGAFIAISSVGASGYIYMFELGGSQEDAKLELFKFLLASCVVGGVLFLYQALLAVRQQGDVDRSNLLNFRSRFLTSYHDIKKARRRFRFLVNVDGDYLIIGDREAFRETYDVLNDAYIEFELLRKISVTQKAMPNTAVDQVREDMRSVDKYIRSIMIELEEADWVGDQPILLSSVSKFHAFLFVDRNPVHVAASKSLDAFLVRLCQEDTSI